MTSAPMVCLLCYEPASSFWCHSRTPEGEGDYWRCHKCGTLVYDTSAPENSLVYSALYYDRRSEASSARAEFRRRSALRHLRIIEKWMGKGRLLDVGCGEGDFLLTAARTGWTDLAGLDISAAAGKSAATVARIERTTIGRSTLQSNSFDVVTLFDALEHLPDPHNELRSIRAFLRPGGLLYLTTPDASGLTARLMRHRWFQLKPGEHLFLYSRRGVRRLLEEVGFRNVRIESGGGKFLTPQYVCAILAATNPRIAAVLRAVLARTPLWRAMLPLPTGDMLVKARA